MIDVSAPRILIVFLTFFLAGTVKGVTGMGLPTVAMGLLGTILPPVEAATLLIVPSFVTNVWQLSTGPNVKGLASRLWPMMLGIVAGTIAGSRLLTQGGGEWTLPGLGAVLMIYAALGLLARQMTIPPRLERRLSPFIGLATGVITGGTGVFVIPAVPYLQALGLDREDLVQALGLSFTVSTIALAIGLTSGGVLPDTLWASGIALAPALLGMGFGQRIRRRIPPLAFRRWFLVCLFLLGLQLLLRPIF